MNRAAGAVLAVLAGALGAATVACTDPVVPRGEGVLVVSQESQASWIRNFNPLLPPGLGRWPSRGGIYEPLLVWNTLAGAYEPWLATATAWSDGGKTLTATLRHDVRWSDNTPFGAGDVAFTFDLIKRHKALDLDGVWTFLAAVEVTAPDTVVFRFQRPYVPGLFYLGQQPIVPAHIWATVEDPVSWANPTPVATGPFTEVEIFEGQLYQLGRNPRYWQGPTAVRSLRFPAFSTNEQANLALINGEVDWAGNFVPAVDRVYGGANRAHHKHWFPLIDGMIALYPSAADPRLRVPAIRKALSLAIDRAMLIEVAMYGYTRPADATGLDDAFATWRDPEAASADWVRHDPEAAGRMLDEAGCPRVGTGVRRCADGKPLALTIQTVAGWSDWVRAAQVIARDLDAVGVDATVRTYDFTAWFDRLQRGDFELSIGWTEPGPTPYPFYRALMASELVLPFGDAAPRNWHRFADAESDALLKAFEHTADPVEQQRLIAGIQRRFVATAPVIPLYPNPSWAEYSTARFTNFPDVDHPYARPSPNRQPETLLVLTRLVPRGDGTPPVANLDGASAPSGQGAQR